MNKDERRGAISCSSLDRIVVCPRSFLLEKACQILYPNANTDTDDSRRGTRLHGAMETYPDSIGDYDVSDEEMEYLEYCWKKYQSIVGDIEHKKEIVEQRLWFEDIISGKIDRICCYPSGDEPSETTDIDVFDWKFGTQAVTDAEMNLQMAGYAFLVFSNEQMGFPIRRVRVHLVCPCVVKGKKYTTAEYFQEDYTMLKALLLEVIEKAENINAPLAMEIGGHCQFCKAISICPKQAENCNEIVELKRDDDLTANPEYWVNAENAVEVFNKTEDFTKRLNQAVKYRDAIKEKLKSIALENPNCGLSFKKGIETLDVEEMPVFVASLIKQLGFTYEELLNGKIYKINKGNLDTLVKAKGVRNKDLKDFYIGTAGCHFKEGNPRLMLAKDED